MNRLGISDSTSTAADGIRPSGDSGDSLYHSVMSNSERIVNQSLPTSEVITASNLLIFPPINGFDRPTNRNEAFSPKGTSSEQFAESKSQRVKETVSPAEAIFWQGVVKPEQIIQLKREINTTGQPPEQALLKAASDSTVIGLGDVHTTRDNPARKLYADMMPKLAKVGVTDLAMELPTSLQPVFDEFMRTGKWNIPADQSRIDYRVLSNIIKYVPDLAKIFEQARLSGIRIACVDAAGAAFPQIPETQRNEAMARNIESIVKAKPDSKVAFLTGSYHLEQGQNHLQTPTAVELLRKDNLKVTTFHPQLGGERDQHTGYNPQRFALYPLTNEISQPVSVPTAQTREFGKLPLWMPGGDTPSNTLSNWDNILIFPEGNKDSLREQFRKPFISQAGGSDVYSGNPLYKYAASETGKLIV